MLEVISIQDPSGTILCRLPDVPVQGRYRLLNADGSEPTDRGSGERTVLAIGAGGFGFVARSEDLIGLPRAIKFTDPAKMPARFDSGHIGDTRSMLSERLAAEVRASNQVPFTRIVPIVDYATVEDLDGRRFVTYVSAFIPGATLDAHIARTMSTLDASDSLKAASLHDPYLSLISQLLEGLSELAAAGVSHLDIKPSNVMAMTGKTMDGLGRGRDSLFIIDLGAAVSRHAHHLPTIPLILTKYFFPTHILEDLGYDDINGTVKTAKLHELGPRIDLYGVGRCLELLFLDRVRRKARGVTANADLVAKEAEKELRARAIFGDDFDDVEGNIGRLLDLTGRGFVSARDAQGAFRAIPRYKSYDVLQSHIVTDRLSRLTINVGGVVVKVAPPLREIVDHPTFQRLRRLNQLSLVSQIFPDATHTRFAHSLRVFDLAKRFLLALNSDSTCRRELGKTGAEHVSIAALLHDVGQYPFAHTIEDLRKLGDHCGVGSLSSIRHDQELAVEFIRRRDGASRSIEAILSQHGFDLNDIVYMFAKTNTPPPRPGLKIGRDLISGVIDVDRLAYLIHDSDRTGVPYGAMIDPSAFANALCVNPSTNALAIHEAGVSSVESILAAVYWMYREVYWKSTNRAFMAAVKEVWWHLLQGGAMTFDQYATATYGGGEWEALRWLHDEFAKFSKDAAGEWHNPLAATLKTQRVGYVRVWSTGYTRPGDLYEGIINGIAPDRITNLVDAITRALPLGTRPVRGEILVDIPLKKRLLDAVAGRDTEAEAGRLTTLTVRTTRRFNRSQTDWVPIEQYSVFAKMLTQIEDRAGRKIRVFLATTLVQRLMESDVGRLEEIVGGAVRELIRPDAT